MKKGGGGGCHALGTKKKRQQEAFGVKEERKAYKGEEGVGGHALRGGFTLLGGERGGTVLRIFGI